MMSFPFSQGGNRFPRLYLNLKAVVKYFKNISLIKSIKGKHQKIQGLVWTSDLPSPSSALEPSAVRCKRTKEDLMYYLNKIRDVI